MESLSPSFNSAIFNTSAFYTSLRYLTKDEADKLYLSIKISNKLNYLEIITPGIAEANKALITDSNIDISNIRNLTLTNNIIVNRSTNGDAIKCNNGIVYTSLHLQTNNAHIGTTTNHNFNLQSNNTNIAQCKANGNFNIVNNLEIAGVQLLSSVDELNYNNITTKGIAEAEKSLVLDSNLDISNINNLSLNKIILSLSEITHTNNKLQLNTSSASGGFRIDSTFFNYSSSLLQLINSNATYGTMSLNIDLVKASPINFRFYSPDSSMIFNTNTISSTATNSLFFSAGGGNIGISTTSPNRSLEINSDCAINRLFIGDTAKTSGDRLINVLTTGACSMRYGRMLSNNNCFTIAYNHISNGSTSNNISFDAFGSSNQLTISATGGVSIGGSSVSGGLSIGTSQTLTYGAGGLTWHRYRVVNNVYDTGIGPTSYNTSLNVGSNYIQCIGVLNTSDIRLKKDVKNIEVDNIIHLYKNIKAKSFIWKHNNQIDMGFIAQDLVKEKHIELIGITEPNNDVIKNILKNDEHPKDDLLYPENIQLNVQYNKFPIYNFTMIQYLLNELEKIKK